MMPRNVVIVASMLLLLLTTVLNIIALGSPNWESAHFNYTGTKLSMAYKGLWQMCVNGQCESLVFSEEEMWFHVFQVLYVVEVIIGVVNIITFFTAAVIPANSAGEMTCSRAILVGSWTQTILLALCLTMFTVGSMKTQAIANYGIYRQPFWAFYVAVASAIFSLATSVLLWWDACVSGAWLRYKEDYSDI